MAVPSERFVSRWWGWSAGGMGMGWIDTEGRCRGNQQDLGLGIGDGGWGG